MIIVGVAQTTAWLGSQTLRTIQAHRGDVEFRFNV